jgi:hypothetical protein
MHWPNVYDYKPNHACTCEKRKELDLQAQELDANGKKCIIHGLDIGWYMNIINIQFQLTINRLDAMATMVPYTIAALLQLKSMKPYSDVLQQFQN